ncbi:hypothetical protein [Salinibacterium sp. ZJ70]|uniref:hypothetical protein n=1 Tax=Salinibacterium sp. ZJ70 TaxID=2708084 RepID=UPI00141F6AAC|nr:hypothetical protein [Salinibacterium sp. ZJ70]
MTDDRITTLDSTDEPVSRIGAIAVAVVFAALTGWFLYQAAGNLINTPVAYENFGWADRVPWAVLVLGVALPVLFYVGALVAVRRQPLTNRVLVFTAALAATAATYFSLYAVALYQVTS